MDELSTTQPELREELLAMAAEDERVRAKLAADGSLFEGYHAQMAEVHQRHGRRLGEIIAQHGWPDEKLVGADGAEAAWLILQHDIGNPKLQRSTLMLLQDAAARGLIPARHAAMLTDRIRVLEGRPQVYGMQFDWDENNEMSPCPIENPDEVDELRKSVGLMPLAEDTRRRRAWILESEEKPPQDFAARRQEMEQWACSVGWREELNRDGQDQQDKKK
jgi:hypothetical protein